MYFYKLTIQYLYRPLRILLRNPHDRVDSDEVVLLFGQDIFQVV